VGNRAGMRGRFLLTVGVMLLAAVPWSGRADDWEPDASLPDLSGRWVTIQRLVALADLPFLGRVSILTTVGLLSDVCQSGSGVTLVDAYCFSDVDVSTALFETDIPDATMRSIEPEPRFADLRVRDGEIQLVQDWHIEVRGAVLDDPVHDDLPTYPADPRVVDMDGDDRIGFTIPAKIVSLFGGDTYVVQRFRYRLEGTLVDPDTIVGLVEWTTEQNVLWATDALLMTSYTQWIDPDPTLHRFLMRRVDEAWTCEGIRDRVAPLLDFLDAMDLSDPS